MSASPEGWTLAGVELAALKMGKRTRSAVFLYRLIKQHNLKKTRLMHYLYSLSSLVTFGYVI